MVSYNKYEGNMKWKSPKFLKLSPGKRCQWIVIGAGLRQKAFFSVINNKKIFQPILKNY